MANVLFIADLHIGHRKILKYRPMFASIQEHDQTIIDNWNKTVKKRDLVWVLGDFMMYNPDYDMETILKMFNGNIRIISGNHDHMEYYPNNLLTNSLVKKYGYWLSHAPIHPQELRGKKNIHGHVHDATIPDDNYLNVCCEKINFTPISLDEVRSLMNT